MVSDGNLTNEGGTAYALSLDGVSNLDGLNIIIDNTIPGSPSVESSLTPDGTYKAGDVIQIEMPFATEVGTGDMQVNGGMPTITMENGTSSGVATFISVSGNVLLFEYTVVDGDVSSDFDFVGTDSFNLNGATITDEAGNAVISVTLPTSGDPGSFSANKDIVIDTAEPVVAITAPLASATVTSSQVISFTDDDINSPQVSVDNSNWTDATTGVTTLGDIPELGGCPTWYHQLPCT